IFLSGMFNLAWAQQSDQTGPPHPGTEAYQTAKDAGEMDVFQIRSIVTDGFPNPVSPLSKHHSDDRNTDCYIPHDTATYTMLPPNDDESTSAIDLPFAFNMYGIEYNSIFINNNGNITFLEEVSGYTPDGFPIDIPMIA